MKDVYEEFDEMFILSKRWDIAFFNDKLHSLAIFGNSEKRNYNNATKI